MAKLPRPKRDDSLGLTPVVKMTKDIVEASATLDAAEARYLVSLYYQMQDKRIGSDAQRREMLADEKPHATLEWVASNNYLLEGEVKRALQRYAESHPVGAWAMSIVGIGPVISAGLLAHIDIERSPTVGHIWRYAGLDPSVKWPKTEDALKWVKENGLDIQKAARYWGRDVDTLTRYATTDAKGEPIKLTEKSLARAISRRPWNADLKVLCWKIGESFVKVQGNEGDYYGKVYASRRAWENEQNAAGAYAEQARRSLEQKKYGEDTDAYKAYIQGRLPDARMLLRAERYATKLFLSHWHHKMYLHRFGEEPPKPYAITQLGHGHYIPVPE